MSAGRDAGAPEEPPNLFKVLKSVNGALCLLWFGRSSCLKLYENYYL